MQSFGQGPSLHVIDHARVSWRSRADCDYCGAFSLELFEADMGAKPPRTLQQKPCPLKKTRSLPRQRCDITPCIHLPKGHGVREGETNGERGWRFFVEGLVGCCVQRVTNNY